MRLTGFPPHQSASCNGCSCSPSGHRVGPCSFVPWQIVPGRDHRPHAVTEPSLAAQPLQFVLLPVPPNADRSSHAYAALVAHQKNRALPYRTSLGGPKSLRLVPPLPSCLTPPLAGKSDA